MDVMWCIQAEACGPYQTCAAKPEVDPAWSTSCLRVMLHSLESADSWVPHELEV